ncbi:hypothetical protein JG688_00011122 [Phytophthora aleatoria]|uniref:Uncharacterized protein n=1 Tax=Phytophthora aleatoria TaxID=2496075 RepID=A0A8J5IV51_9STRA|nr:hypothetical protein JG688_00011122 [Phytophthora aleatoria]
MPGCRLVTPTLDASPLLEQQKTEAIHLAGRPSGNEEAPRLNYASSKTEGGFPAEVFSTKAVYDPPQAIPKLFNSNSSVSVAPPTVTSQLSSIVDMCEEMEEEEVQSKVEAVLERLLRAQYRLEQLGNAVTPEISSPLEDMDAQFRALLEF